MIRVRAEVWESRAVISERYLIPPWWLRVTARTQSLRSGAAPGDGTLVQPGLMGREGGLAHAAAFRGPHAPNVPPGDRGGQPQHRHLTGGAAPAPPRGGGPVRGARGHRRRRQGGQPGGGRGPAGRGGADGGLLR